MKDLGKVGEAFGTEDGDTLSYRKGDRTLIDKVDWGCLAGRFY